MPRLKIEGRDSALGSSGAADVLWAYLQVLDRLIPRGLAWEGPIYARRRETSAGVFGPSSARSPGPRSGTSVGVQHLRRRGLITPPAAHAAYALAALEAGKHVVCEKPVGMSRAEAEPVFDLAASRGLLLLAAPFVQLSPTFRELWTRVHDGESDTCTAPEACTGTRARPGRRGSMREGWDRSPKPASTT